MDELLPRSFLECIQMYLSMLSILILNALALPWTLIPTFVLVLMFVTLLRWYLNAAQAVKRLEGTSECILNYVYIAAQAMEAAVDARCYMAPRSVRDDFMGIYPILVV